MTPTAYPLQWPAGWPKSAVKEKSKFQTNLNAALKFLRDEVRLLGGTNLVLSSNVTLDCTDPSEPGVCAYFTLGKQSVAIPCDRWNRVHDNVKAIALTVEAMRGMERWGAKHMIQAMFQGFKALPQKSGRSWHEVLGVQPNADGEQILMAYRTLAKKLHPDAGGKLEDWEELVQAKDIAIATFDHSKR